MKNVILRITSQLCKKIKSDLARPHEYAFERVGFVIGRGKTLEKNTELICLTEFFPVADEDYIPDRTVGARINAEAIRKAMQIAMDLKCSVFHVHEHSGKGTPEFSYTDLKELPHIADAMLNANNNSIHGILLLSDNSANAILRRKNIKKNFSPYRVVVVGYPMLFNKNCFSAASFDKKRYDRQTFLGNHAQKILSAVRVGIVGLGGGGSHIVQQLAHIGIVNYILFDDDFVSVTNLNRLVGATLQDARKKKKKTFVSERLIKGLHPKADVKVVNDKWQQHSELLHSCDLVFGAVDSFAGRRDLELDCRRYLIPYLDIGMDVKIISPEAPRLFGQVILSLPGNPCMKCMDFLTEENMALEAARYGDAGSKPQVIWANGVLASTAVGIGIDLLTGWTTQRERLIYQEYDGNLSNITAAYRIDYLGKEECKHFPIKNAGPPVWK